MVSKWVNYYEVLGISHSATDLEIRAAFVRLIKEVHPDVNQGTEESTHRTQLIIDAYSTLKDARKRREHDGKLEYRRTAHTTSSSGPEYDDPEENEHQTTESEYTDPVAYACDCCGRADVSLRYYIFAWVVSYILATRHGQTPLILCKICRFRKTFEYTLGTGLLGWWGFPWGIIYTLVGLIQNLLGGLYPRDFNAALLAAHGYALYTNGCYVEAMESILESNRLIPTSEKAGFIDFLRTNMTPVSRKTMVIQRLLSINPAWLLFPLISWLAFVGVSNYQNADSGYHERYQSEAVVSVPAAAPATEDEQSAEAAKIGFDIQGFRADVRSANQCISDLATYVHDNVPEVGTHNEGSIIVHDYVLDRDKLASDKVHVFTTALRGSLTAALKRADAAGLGDASSNSQPTSLAKYESDQIDFMRSCLFNATILDISLDYWKVRKSSGGLISVTQSVFALRETTQFGDWLSRKRETDKLSVLTSRLRKAESAQTIKGDIAELRGELHRTQASIDNINQLMDSYTASGSTTAYNDLVPQPNDLVYHSRDTSAALDNAISKYNAIIDDLDKNSIVDAFDDCIDSRILLTQFDQVDLKTKHP